MKSSTALAILFPRPNTHLTMHFPTLLLTLSTLSLAILATPVPSSPLSADLIARDPTPQSGPSDFTDCYDDEHCRETGDEAHRRLRTKPNGDGNRLGTKRQAEGSDIGE